MGLNLAGGVTTVTLISCASYKLDDNGNPACANGSRQRPERRTRRAQSPAFESLRLRELSVDLSDVA
jgi:hypothetical protein